VVAEKRDRGRESSRFVKKAARKLLWRWANGVVGSTPTAQHNKVFLLLFVHKK
jgi:hypothetical protein